MMVRRQVLKSIAVGALVALAVALNPLAISIAAAKDTRVALIMTGPITDGGWAQLAYEGLAELGNRDGFEVAYAENVKQASITRVVQGYADDGYDLIIGHGYEFGSAFIEIAPEYPDQKFFASTFKPADTVPSNTGYADLAYYDASYGAGALAALISEKKQAVGYVGGGDNPTQQRMMKSFIAGAERTTSGIKGLGIITGDYDNAGRGRESAITMAANGADVIWHGANVTGLGAIQGGVSAGAKVLGCYSDQTSLAADKMGTSFVMNLGWMVQQMAEAVAANTFPSGQEWQPKVTDMWSLKAGDKGDHNSDVVSDAAWSAFQKIWDDLGTGSIKVAEIVK